MEWHWAKRGQLIVPQRGMHGGGWLNCCSRPPNPPLTPPRSSWPTRGSCGAAWPRSTACRRAVACFSQRGGDPAGAAGAQHGLRIVAPTCAACPSTHCQLSAPLRRCRASPTTPWRLGSSWTLCWASRATGSATVSPTHRQVVCAGAPALHPIASPVRWPAPAPMKHGAAASATRSPPCSQQAAPHRVPRHVPGQRRDVWPPVPAHARRAHHPLRLNAAWRGGALHRRAGGGGAARPQQVECKD